MKVLIVDDEMPARARLARILGELEDWEAVAEASNGTQAIELCTTHLPDVVLMDIRMPGMNGIEAARHIATMERPPAVIFTTAYDGYAMEAFDAQAVGYLVKPVRKERLERALLHAARPTRAQLAALTENGDEQQPARRRHLAARIADRLRLIPVESVYYFQADQKYTSVCHVEGEVLIDEPLKDLEREFGDDFLRIHRNALVALKHLESVERDDEGRYWARLKGSDQRLSVSRRHATSLRRKLRGN